MTVLGATLRPLPVTSGVPQRSILGPLLFLLYGNHLSYAETNSRIATFADDTKIFKTINSISDASALQNDPSNFQDNSSHVNHELNNTKCKVLRVTRKHNKITYPYKLNEAIIESTDCERDFGFSTSSTLTSINKLTISLQQSHENAGICPKINLKILQSVADYIQLRLVRSKLCYGSQIWAPQSVTSIKRA